MLNSCIYAGFPMHTKKIAFVFTCLLSNGAILANDSISGTPNDDRFDADTADETFLGDAGNDTYAFDKFFGSDVIEEPLYFRDQDTQIPVLATDRNWIEFTYHYSDEVNFNAKQGSLILETSRKDQIEVKDFFAFGLINSRGFVKKDEYYNPIYGIRFNDDESIAEDDLIDRLESEFWYLTPRGIDFTAIDAPESRENPSPELNSCDSTNFDILKPIYSCSVGYIRGDYPKFLAVKLRGFNKNHLMEAYSQEGELIDTALGGDSLLLKPKKVHFVKITEAYEWREFWVAITTPFFPVAP